MPWYKAFNKDLMCREMQYEIGKEYKMDESPILGERGFHFCKEVGDCYKFYPLTEETRICEIEPLGEIMSDEQNIKFCTNYIKILKEINPKDFYKSYHREYCNLGDYDIGDKNIFKLIMDESGNWIGFVKKKVRQ